MDTAALQRVLTDLRFCRHMAFEGPTGTGSDARIENLYARRGTVSPIICFAGHTDVVPTGNSEAWSSAPFGRLSGDGLLSVRTPVPWT
jgi:succinyl-diaminopimelate desuccinylase